MSTRQMLALIKRLIEDAETYDRRTLEVVEDTLLRVIFHMEYVERTLEDLDSDSEWTGEDD